MTEQFYTKIHILFDSYGNGNMSFFLAPDHLIHHITLISSFNWKLFEAYLVNKKIAEYIYIYTWILTNKNIDELSSTLDSCVTIFHKSYFLILVFLSNCIGCNYIMKRYLSLKISNVYIHTLSEMKFF